jgi:hypothetical protein
MIPSFRTPELSVTATEGVGSALTVMAVDREAEQLFWSVAVTV